MQATSEADPNEDRRSEPILVKRMSPESMIDPRYRDALSTQMSQGGSPMKVEDGNRQQSFKIEGAHDDSSYSNSVASSPEKYAPKYNGKHSSISGQQRDL